VALDRSAIAVATMTLVRDKDEDRLVRAALERLARKAWPIAVADGGSPDDFVRFLRHLPEVTVVDPDVSGLVGQIKASVRAAASAGKPLVFYTEPDKADFFETHLDDFLRRAPADSAGGIVLAARSAQALSTFPLVQRFTESTFNRACAESLDTPGDYTYGPFVFDVQLARRLDAAPDDLGWGWRPYLFALAHRLDRRIAHVAGEFVCPPGQRLDEEGERIHRMRQLAQNINGLVQGLTSARL
jgi:hypothetical protein